MKRYNKTKFIGIRVSEKDYDFLKSQLQENEKLSGYCRKRLLQTDENRQMERDRNLKELVYQVRKIGININQVVARMNTGISFSDDREKLWQELERVYQLLEEFAE